jgi:tetratricopeptide (TPR) repeat protein
VRAALAIQSALEALDQEVQNRLGVPFRMRIGIHTGPVVVGRIGDDLRMDYTAVGDTTNLAARLQQAAPPGSILISDATEALVAGFFDLEDLGGIWLKGKSQPVHAFRVQGERAVSGRIEAAGEAGLTPLVGRERDLDTLADAFESARSGRGQVVFLVGEAGIGKSRLVHDFRQRLTDPHPHWFEGRCVSYATNSPFHPVIDALRRAFQIEDDDEDAVGRVEAGIEALGSDMAWTAPFLRQLLSLPTGDERVERMLAGERRSETIRALRAIFHRAADPGPLVFVVEDLHWIDVASEEFLTFLADSVAGIRALFLFTHRPGYRHPFGDRSYHLRLSLQPLSEENMKLLVGSLLATRQLPETLARLIAEKSDGNPFFIEELTRSLLDEGVLCVDRGRAELTRKVGDVAIPDRIQDVLMARIDRLDDGAKRAIQIASVIGREFAMRLLERIVEAGEEVQSMVGELRALELIYEKAAHPELAFMFKHALTHDVAYASVLVQRRRALHCIVGTAIEELYRDRLAEHYEALAHHFTRGEDWERALRYHEFAADKAADAYANQAAVEHYRQSLEIADRLGAPREQRMDLEERLGAILNVMSAFGPSGEAYLRAAELAGDGERGARNLARAADSLLWAHDYERGRLAWSRSLRVAHTHGARAAEAMALAVDGLQSCVEGDFDDAWQERHQRAAEIAEETGDPEAILLSCSYVGFNFKHCGESRRAIAILEHAVANAEEHGLMPSFAMWGLGLSLGAIGQYGRAVAMLGQAVDQCERIGNTAVQARLQNSLGWCLAEIGCHARASEHNRRSSEIAAEMVKRDLVAGAPELYANAEINLAGNLLASGDHQGATPCTCRTVWPGSRSPGVSPRQRCESWTRSSRQRDARDPGRWRPGLSSCAVGPSW